MILPGSPQLRRTAIAYLFQNVVTQQRSDNLAFYDEITKEGLDFPEMQQLPRELVLLQRGSPGHLAEIHVGSMDVAAAPGAPVTAAAFRLLVAETGSSKPIEFFRDTADAVFEAFCNTWGTRRGRLQLVEVSIIAIVAANDPGGAAAFLRDHVMNVAAPAKDHLGRDFGQFGVKLGSGVVVEIGPNPVTTSLPGAQVDLNIESNIQDPQSLVLTLLVKWPLMQLRLSELQMPPEIKAQLGGRDFLEMNIEPKEPNLYIEQAYGYLNDRVMPFLRATGR